MLQNCFSAVSDFYIVFSKAMNSRFEKPRTCFTMFVEVIYKGISGTVSIAAEHSNSYVTDNAEEND